MSVKNCLISVFNKDNLDVLTPYLEENNYNIYTTGGTYSVIHGLIKDKNRVISISDYTKFPEICSGRVKTLHPKIYGGILGLRDVQSHLDDLQQNNCILFDIVVVNLYPFVDYYKKYKRNKVIEMIDIGGPSLIRAASKNFQYVTAINEIDDYSKLIRNLEKNKGETDYEFRKKMAAKTFKTTSKYDRLIYNWINIYVRKLVLI